MANSYPVNIPTYSDTADIQKAFLLYHYGIDSIPGDDFEILPNSMAGYIRDTITAFQQAEDRLSVIPKLSDSQNLNDTIANGINLATDSPTLLLNYPTTERGILTIVTDENDILTFQTYQTINTANDFYWRSATLSGGTRNWSAWSKSSKDGHTHDGRYYTKSQMDNKISTTLGENKAVVTDGTTLSTVSTVSSAEVAFLEGLTANIQDQLNDKAPAVHSHNDLYYTKSEQPRIFVQDPSQGAPSGQSGDLWFW